GTADTGGPRMRFAYPGYRAAEARERGAPHAPGATAGIKNAPPGGSAFFISGWSEANRFRPSPNPPPGGEGRWPQAFFSAARMRAVMSSMGPTPSMRVSVPRFP